TLYDLTLNTERVGIASCVDEVIRLAASPEFAETPESTQKLRDLAFEAKARAALRADSRTAGIDIAMDVAGGIVTLRGIVVDDREKTLVVEVVKAVPGAGTVRDELRTMAGGLARFPSQTR
ncbi:MAG TPA: BON domain-containing protein, partial [Usitatibacter sp.]|nr:BON domain-containing protein [Usitatibacter sp.]